MKCHVLFGVIGRLSEELYENLVSEAGIAPAFISQVKSCVMTELFGFSITHVHLYELECLDRLFLQNFVLRSEHRFRDGILQE